MKHIFFILLNLYAFWGFTQNSILPIDSITKKITYTDVVKVDSASESKLYSAAKLWVATTYKSSKTVTQLNDDESFTIVIKAIIEPLWEDGASMGYVNYTITIQCKNGRYKYSITDLYHEKPIGTVNNCSAGPLEQAEYVCPGLLVNKKKLWFEIRNQTNRSIVSLIQDLKNAMSSTSDIRRNDW